MNNFNAYSIRDYQQDIGGHAVEIVGWGRDLVSRAALGLSVSPGSVPDMYIDYWIIKNSWGQIWGTPAGTWGINNKGYAKIAMANANIGLNINLGLESPRPVNVAGLTFHNYGCFRFFADSRSPYPPDMCEYRCPNFLLERRCPGQREFTTTTELCYHD
jgi:hypothetical protein